MNLSSCQINRVYEDGVIKENIMESKTNYSFIVFLNLPFQNKTSMGF